MDIDGAQSKPQNGLTPILSLKRTHNNSVTKSPLTPYRRFGLGRLSSRSLQKGITLRTVTTPLGLHSHEEKITREQCNEDKMSEVNLGTPLRNFERVITSSSNRTVTKKFVVRRCLNNAIEDVNETNNENKANTNYVESKSCSESPCTEESIKKALNSLNDVSPTCSNLIGNVENEKDEPHFDVTPEMIKELKSTIEKKKKKIEQLKVQETYAKKHDLNELRADTEKWRVGGQQALRYMQKLAEDNGHKVSLMQIMEQYGFPPDLMRYNAEEEDFD